MLLLTCQGLIQIKMELGYLLVKTKQESQSKC
jgi:hypothetical protein